MTSPIVWGTISGKFRVPGIAPRQLGVMVQAVADSGTVIASDGSIISGTYKGTRTADGTLSVQLPTSVTPADARWRASFYRLRQGVEDGKLPKPLEFFQEQVVAEGVAWEDLIDVSGVPFTPSLLLQAQDARDAAIIARDDTIEARDDTIAALIAQSGIPGLGVDTDGTPYFDAALAGQPPAYALAVDTDGTPYLIGA